MNEELTEIKEMWERWTAPGGLLETLPKAEREAWIEDYNRWLTERETANGTPNNEI